MNAGAADARAGLAVAGLSKSFAGRRALDDVSLAVEAGHIHALLGSNGSGKSTLIKILAGVYQGEPGGTVAVGDARIDAAKVTPGWAREQGMAFVHQDLGIFPNLSVAENLFAGLTYPRRAGGIAWRELRRQAREVLALRSIDARADAPIGTLSAANQTLVAIARALGWRDRIHGGVLVLDEPTARLPPDEVGELFEALHGYAAAGQTIVFVSHRLDEVMDGADAVSVLRDGRKVLEGPIAGLTQADLVGAIAGAAPLAEAASHGTVAGTGGERLVVEGLAAGPLRRVDLAVASGEVVGVAGIVDGGGTALLESIFGARHRAAGTVRLDGAELRGGDIRAAIARGVAYVPKDRALQAGFMELTVAQNLVAADRAEVRRPWRSLDRLDRPVAEARVADYGIRTAGVGQTFATLSGGNQQKVVIARALARDPVLLLLDDPTQGVDVAARAQIYAQIGSAVDRGSSVLVVSSDFEELEVLADRVLVLRAGEVVEERRRGAFDRHWLTGRVYGIDRKEGGMDE